MHAYVVEVMEKAVVLAHLLDEINFHYLRLLVYHEY